MCRGGERGAVHGRIRDELSWQGNRSADLRFYILVCNYNVL